MVENSTDSERVQVLGVRYDNLTVPEAVERTLHLLEEDGRSSVFFLNSDCVRQAQRDPEYRLIINSAKLVLSDGIGLRLLTRLCGERMRDNCNGTDLSPRLIAQFAARGHSIFLLGGKAGVAEKAAAHLRQQFPGVRVAGTGDGYFQNDDEAVERVNHSGADVLFVAMGAPRQEKWIARNRARLRPRLCLGVGALLDYLSGTIPRAPEWMIRLNVEWLWRILIDPGRMFKRYIVDGIGFMVSALVLVGVRPKE